MRRAWVAEDDQEMLSLIVGCLQTDGYQVEPVSSGKELCERLEDEDTLLPDIVVSDIRMPGTTGLDAVAKFRAAGWTFPVILVTGFGDEATLNAAAEHGATLVLCKPFDMDQLRFAVASLCPIRSDTKCWSYLARSEPD